MLKKYDKVLYEIVTGQGLISEEAIRPVVKEVESSGGTLVEALAGKGLVPEKKMLELIAENLHLSFVDLKTYPVDTSIIKKIPVRIASYYKFIPLEVKDGTLRIAVSYPLDIKTQDEIRMQLGYDIEAVLSCAEDIIDGLRKHYGLAADTLHDIMSQKSTGPGMKEAGEEKIEDIEKLIEDASVIKLVNQIILEGWRKRATDIHIEPYRGGVALRYRIDGILYDANVPAEIRHFIDAIISRIKIMSNLNIVERRLPQDGRAIVKVQNQVLDLRVSTMPTPFGESIVVRILPTQLLFSLEKLGLAGNDLKVLEDLVRKPHGIIFITGPTGSGKTTTLYACLNTINTKDRKIITLEDPIEYEMQGITQIQVQPEIDFDFARGLRSVLRHDPDVIMVGEVRDLETAEIAVRVALTGHLVFSTLHTNDAASGITRLIDIGVEPYLVVSSIEAFIGQRLIRVICPHCKYEDTSAPQELKEMIRKELGLRRASEAKIYRAKGCARCNNTGFFGRTAIYEVLLVDEDIKDLILKKSPANQIRRTAISKGMRTLRQDGWSKVIAGTTTPEEVMRVSPAEKDAPGGSVDETLTNDRSDAGAEETHTAIWKKGVLVKNADTLVGDRRVYARVDYNVNFRYKILGTEEETKRVSKLPDHAGATKDISAGGLLFVSNVPLRMDSILEIRLELPDEKAPVECLGRVVRVTEKVLDRTYDIGICFLDIRGADRTRLKTLCKDMT
jgi:type II secretory ATPase GspE/PulE/Tfp pilus assembly ATPase PilB-like protein